jgi:shikimate dehydrogenase
MLPTLNRDTQLCMSIAARPSNIGTRFHNYLYRELGLNYVYKAFTTTDIEGAIRGVRALGIRGTAISMPFKEAVIPLVDEMMASAAAIASVNTIVNDAGYLRAYNTDYQAARLLIDSHGVPRDFDYALLGSGGMAKAVGAALRDAGFARGTIIARNETTGRVLAETLGAAWRPELGDHRPALLINVTPIGMAGGKEADDLAFAREAVEAASAVFDVVAMPVETPLVRLARSLGKAVIDGGEVLTLQAVEQFVLYTGVRPEPDLVRQAQAFARAV